MIKTSYFKKARDIPNAVSIARSDFPWSMKGYRFKKYPTLMPTIALLRSWKKGNLTESQYSRRYYKETLGKLNPEKVYKDLDGKILLCHEPSGNFCHRRLVAKWIKDLLGIEVPEL